MKPFTSIHHLPSRDLNRDWSLSQVKTKLFDVDKQPVTCFQHPWELGALIDIYAKHKPKGVLELGPCHGGTLYWFLLHAASGATVGTVDFFDELLGTRETTLDDWKKWVKKGVDFKHFEGDTHDAKIQDAVSTHFEQGIDWLFIDANHDYEHVMADFTDYGAMVNDGGVIALHDVRPRNMGSSRLFEELRQAGYVTQLLVADPYSDQVDAGVGIVYV